MHEANCICVETALLIRRLVESLPDLLHIAAIVITFLAVVLVMCGLLGALLRSWLIHQLADSVRGEKRKRKNDEVE